MLKFIRKYWKTHLFVSAVVVYTIVKKNLLERKKHLDNRCIYHKNVKKNKKIHQILSTCKSVLIPDYVPTVFACNKWINTLCFLIRLRVIEFFYKCNIRRQTIDCIVDNGQVAIDWYEDSRTKNLKKNAPILIFLHTISGTSATTAYFLKDAAERGYRACVFTRRGHFGATPLKSPRFNFMGDKEDIVLCCNEVKRLYKDAWIGMIGISAGSGLLMSYLGQEYKDTPVSAACSLCPAYALFPGLKNLRDQYAFADKYVLKSVKQMYLYGKSNSEMLKQYDNTTYNKCKNAKSLYEFAKVAYPFAGCKTLDEYNKVHNPMEHFSNINIPVLVLNSDDDMCCVKDNIREDLVENLPNFVLVRTKYGGHISFSEGYFAENSFMVRLTLDWMDACFEHDNGVSIVFNNNEIHEGQRI